MTDTMTEQAVVLYGADGTKYVIPNRELTPYEVGKVSEVPKIEVSEDVTPLVAAQVQTLDDGQVAFYYYGAT